MPTTIILAGDPEPDLLKREGAPPYEFAQHQLRVEAGSYPLMHLLDDVQRPGKDISLFSFSVLPGFTGTAWELLDAHLGGVTPARLRAYLVEIECRHPYAGSTSVLEGTDGQRLYRQRLRATSVYAVLALPRIPKLTAVPKKWTLADVKRALANGQFKELRCDGEYSDDYARDAMHNYHVGPRAAESILAPVMADGARSGWRTYLDAETMRVTINQHHFNRNSFTLVL